MELTKEQIEKMVAKEFAKFTDVSHKRPNDQDDDKEIPNGLSFEDSNGVIHKALGPGEKLYKRELSQRDGDGDFSVGKIIRAKIVGNCEGLNDIERRAAGEGTGSMGGWLVPEQVSAKILDRSRAFARVMQAGAWILPLSSPETKLVKIEADPQSYFKAESQPGTISDWQLGELNLKTMKLICIVRSSLELLEDAKNAGSALEMSIAKSIGNKMDEVALVGDGVNAPLGIDHAIPAGNIVSMGANGAAPTSHNELSQILEAVAVANGESNAFIMNPRSYFQFDRLKAATTNQRLDKPLSVQKIFDDGKMYHTNQVGIVDVQGTSADASKCYSGDFKQLVFGVLKGLRFEFTRSGGTGTFSQYEALLRAVVRMDIGILRSNHFSKIEGLIP